MDDHRAIAGDGVRAKRPVDYDLSRAQLDPAVPLEDHRDALNVVRGWFRRAGLSADEATVLVDRFNAAVDPYTRPAGETERLSDDAASYLKARWGADYEANMMRVRAAIARLGGEPLDHFLRESGLRFDPFVLRTLAEAARRQGWAGEEAAEGVAADAMAGDDR